MTKFINGRESIASALLLWDERPTQISVQETFDMKVWPVTNIFNDGPINFVIPQQPKGMLTDIHVVTKVKVQHNGADITTIQKSLSIVNNFANSLWSLVDVKIDDRIDLTQSMWNAYTCQTFFNHALNSESNRQDYMLLNELFKMDQCESKESEETNRVYSPLNESRDPCRFAPQEKLTKPHST